MVIKTRSTRTPGPSGNPPEWQRLRTRAERMADSCLEAGFPVESCCSGCRIFHNTIPPERRFNLKALPKKRSITHGSERYRCSKPWQMNLSEAVGPLAPAIEAQLKHLQLNQTTLFVSDDEDDEGNAEEANETDSSSSSAEEEEGTHCDLHMQSFDLI